MPLYSSPIEIRSSNFSGGRVNLRGRPGFVMFYASWCPHCVNMVDTWKTLHRKHGDRYAVKAIDCADDAGQRVCREFGVQGFPTIMVADASGMLSDYHGSRDFDSLSSALQSMRGGARRRKRTSPRRRRSRSKRPKRKSPRKKSQQRRRSKVKRSPRTSRKVDITPKRQASTQDVKDCVSQKIPVLISEGYPRKQAIAIAYSMCGRKKSSGR